MLEESRRRARAAARNREPLLAALERLVPRPQAARADHAPLPAGSAPGGGPLVLELGSGTGEHAVFFAARLPWLTWQPSDPDEASRASIQGWTAHAGARNVLPPLHLDLLAPTWRLRRCDALLTVNVLHLAPAAGVEALVAGAAEVLSPGGPLLVAGPFRRRGEDPPFALRRLDEALRASGAGHGLRELDDLIERAAAHGLALVEVSALPDDAMLAAFRKPTSAGP